ncbi:MAG: flagellar biosynthetic protein FliO [Gammaproteobacteria bacterium]|nr:flagellar biosynthetic protein FliO [Gammaproteobacteria bacterium]
MIAAAQTGSPMSAGSLAQVALSLLLIVGLILAISWLLKRLRFGTGAGHGRAAVLEEVVVGPRERVMLVRVGDAQVLIGVGAGGIVALAPLAVPIAGLRDPQSPGGIASQFRDLLARAGATK